MTPADPNLDSLALANQIIDLQAEIDRELKEGRYRYQRAADLRDQRVALEKRLGDLGNATIIRNLKLKVPFDAARCPVLAMMEREESVDPTLLRRLDAAPLPPRWILNACGGSCRTTVAKRLDVDSLASPYFQAHLPLLGSATLAKTAQPMERLIAAIREAARTPWPVVWIFQEPAYLAERGLLDVVLQVLHVASTHFVVCLTEADAAFVSRFADIPSVTMIAAS